jgi:Glycosyltransferase family 87
MKKYFTPEIVLTFVAASVLLVGALLWADNLPGITETDFSVTYIGARMVHLGMGSRLYNLSEQKRIKDSLNIGGKTLIFEHPPFEALLLSPLAGFSYRTAYLVWGLLSIAIWLSLPFLLRPCLPVPSDPVSYAFLWLLFAPLWITLYVGQSSLVILLLFAVAFLFLKRGHDFRSGVAIGLTLFKFQFALPFICIFLLRKKWRVTQGFAVTALSLAALSLAVVGWSGISSYAHLLAAVTSDPDNLSYGAAVDMATIQGFVHGAFGRILTPHLSLLCVAAISGLLLFWTARNWNRVERSRNEGSNDLMFATALVVSLVTGFHMFTHDLSPMLLAMFLAAAYVRQSREFVIRMTLVVCLFLFWLAPVFFLLLAQHCMFLLAPVLVAFAMVTGILATRLRGESATLEPTQALTGVVRA